MKKINFIFVFLLILSGCKSEQSATRAIASASELCGRYRWDDSNLPLRLTIDKDLNNRFFSLNDANSDTISPGVTDSIKTWEDAINRGNGTIFSPSIQILETSPEHNELSLYRFDRDDSNKEIFGIHRSNNWMSGQLSSALAVTYYTVTVNYGTNLYRLTSADIIFNFRDHKFLYDSVYVSTTDGSGRRQYDLQTVLTHELGHFLGYCHVETTEYGSVMQPFYNAQKRELSADDRIYINNLYRQNNITTSSLKTKQVVDPKDTEEIHFVVELLADGECNHYQEGKKFYSHKVDLSKKHRH